MTHRSIIAIAAGVFYLRLGNVFLYALRPTAVATIQALIQYYRCCRCYYCYGYNGYSLVQHSAVAANHRGLQLDPDHHQSATSAERRADESCHKEYGCLDMGAHTSCCAHLGRVLCSQLLWPPFFSHCASSVSISIPPLGI